MDITYLGHSAFKLKGKEATVVCDPFDKKTVGFSMPSTSADVVTISHLHEDHNATKLISGTARRPEPYVIQAPGEYEINGVGIFGWRSYHDAAEGSERGKNTIYSIIMDGVRVVHVGDLGHIVDEDLVEGLGAVDVLLTPVGGVYTIGPKEAAAVIEKLSPQIVIPMHFKTPEHNPATFAELAEVDEFLKLMGVTEYEPLDKLKVTPENLPLETQVVVLKRS